MCKFCKYVVGQEIDLYSMMLYTPLPELWDIFQTILIISPINETGFTMMGADAYLRGYDTERLQVTHKEFWKVMVYFLSRVNEKFREQRKAKLLRERK